MKNIKNIIVASFYLLLFTFNSAAQSVGINAVGAAPDASALLDLSSTDKGFLITRVDTNNIVSPAFGLMTLAPIDSCLYLYNGINWIGIGGGGYDCSCNCNDPKVAPPIPPCGSPFTDARDGEVYETVELGSQCWMSQNLRYLPSSGNFWCYDDNNSNCNTYDRLYDWNTAMNNAPSSNTNPSGVQGICPAGWHLPSDAEWQQLEVHLGMSPAVANSTNWRGTNQGTQLKSTAPVWNGTNSSGFSAFPGGFRGSNGMYIGLAHYGNWWTATEQDGTNAWLRTLWGTQNDVFRLFYEKSFGVSIRCVRD